MQKRSKNYPLIESPAGGMPGRSVSENRIAAPANRLRENRVPQRTTGPGEGDGFKKPGSLRMAEKGRREPVERHEGRAEDSRLQANEFDLERDESSLNRIVQFRTVCKRNGENRTGHSPVQCGRTTVRVEFFPECGRTAIRRKRPHLVGDRKFALP